MNFAAVKSWKIDKIIQEEDVEDATAKYLHSSNNSQCSVSTHDVLGALSPFTLILKDWLSGSSSKSQGEAYLASMRPWVQTPWPPEK
jgi:hypothetical protein